MIKYIYSLDLALNSSGVCIFTNDGQFVKSMTIDTNKLKETKNKLYLIGTTLKKLLTEFPPEKIIIEQGFTRYNTSTQAVFKVHGVINFLFHEFEQIYYPASTVKKVIGGKGNMTKEEVKNAILQKYPGLMFSSLDESDAFAVGETYFIKENIKK